MTDFAHIGGFERRKLPMAPLLITVASVLVVGGVIMGALFFATVTAPVTVPRLSGITTAQASDLLASKRLVDGSAYYDVTREFPPGYVTGQQPLPGSVVKAGSVVNVRVAVAPKIVEIPDLHLYDLATAQRTITPLLLKPFVLYAYSKEVEGGRVIEQLPRAGDTAMSGSEEALVVSLGPGVGGSTVPSVIGRTLGPARSLVTSAALFAVTRPVDAPGIDAGTIVDQAPSAGTPVPVTSKVVLSYAVVAP